MPCPLPCTMGSHRIFISYQNPRVGGRNSCPVILSSVKPGATPACTCGSQFLCTICGVSIFWHHVIGTYHSAWKRDDTDGQCPALSGGVGGAGKAIYQVWSRPAGSRPECLSSVDFQWIPFCWESELLPDKLHTTRWALSWTEFECLKNCENRSCSPAVF